MPKHIWCELELCRGSEISILDMICLTLFRESGEKSDADVNRLLYEVLLIGS